MRRLLASVRLWLQLSVLAAPLALASVHVTSGCARPQPRAALSGGEFAVVKLLVGVDGRVKQVRVVRSNSATWSAIVSRTATQWRFEPAKQDGRKVEAWVEKRVRLNLVN